MRKSEPLKSAYRRARKNYLARVRTAVRQGYQVETVKIPKRVTEASIRRLNKLTGEAIRKQATLVNMLTGEALEPRQKGRAKVAKQNRTFSKLTPMEQEIAYELQTTNIEQIHTAATGTGEAPVLDYEVMIQNWYDRIALERPEVYQYLESKTNELLLGADAETRRRFAYAYDQHADIFPEGLPYLNKNLINVQFDQIRQVMEWAPDSEAYQDFISLYSQEVESEE